MTTDTEDTEMRAKAAETMRGLGEQLVRQTRPTGALAHAWPEDVADGIAMLETDAVRDAVVPALTQEAFTAWFIAKYPPMTTIVSPLLHAIEIWRAVRTESA